MLPNRLAVADDRHVSPCGSRCGCGVGRRVRRRVRVGYTSKTTAVRHIHESSTRDAGHVRRYGPVNAVNWSDDEVRQSAPIRGRCAGRSLEIGPIVPRGKIPVRIGSLPRCGLEAVQPPSPKARVRGVAPSQWTRSACGSLCGICDKIDSSNSTSPSARMPRRYLVVFRLP